MEQNCTCKHLGSKTKIYIFFSLSKNYFVICTPPFLVNKLLVSENELFLFSINPI